MAVISVSTCRVDTCAIYCSDASVFPWSMVLPADDMITVVSMLLFLKPYLLRKQPSPDCRSFPLSDGLKYISSKITQCVL